MSETTLGFQLRALTVPKHLPHKTRAEEIEELPQFLEVVSLVSPGLSLLNIGVTEPGSERAAFPWLKLNSAGEPAGIYYNVGGNWRPVENKLYMRANRSDEYVERGTATITLAVAINTWTTAITPILFSNEFDDIPQIICTIAGGSLLDVTSGFNCRVLAAEANTKQFYLKSVAAVDTASVAKTVKVEWIAIGTRRV